MLRRRLTRNTLSKLVGEVASRLLGLVFYIFFARWLGAYLLGQYSAAFAYASLFAAIVDFGSNPIITREIARDRARLGEIAAHVNGLKAASVVLLIAVLALSLAFVPERPGGKTLVLMMGLFVAGNALLEYFAAILSGLEYMGREAALRASHKAFGLAGAGAGYYVHGSLRAVVIGLLVGTAANLVVSGLVLHRSGAPFSLNWRWRWKRAFLSQSLPLLTAWVFWNFYNNQSVVLLTWLKTSMQNLGLFAAGMRLVDVLRGLPVLLSGAFFPVLASLSRDDPRSFRRLAIILLQWTVVIAFPIATGAYLLAEPIIRWIYGAGFVGGVPVLAAAAWAVIGIFVNNVLINLLIVLERSRKTVIGAAAVMAAHLALNLALIPHFGIRGAAWALVLSEAAYLVLNLSFLQPRLGILTTALLAFLWKPAVASAIMAAVLFQGRSWPIGPSILVAVAVYSAVLLVLRGLPARTLSAADAGREAG